MYDNRRSIPLIRQEGNCGNYLVIGKGFVRKAVGLTKCGLVIEEEESQVLGTRIGAARVCIFFSVYGRIIFTISELSGNTHISQNFMLTILLQRVLSFLGVGVQPLHVCSNKSH